MDSLAPATLLPPSLASTEDPGPPQTKEHLLVLEEHGPAGGIADANRIRLCMCPEYCAGKKKGYHPLPQRPRETLQLVGSWKSQEMLVLGTSALIRTSLC